MSTAPHGLVVVLFSSDLSHRSVFVWGQGELGQASEPRGNGRCWFHWYRHRTALPRDVPAAGLGVTETVELFGGGSTRDQQFSLVEGRVNPALMSLLLGNGSGCCRLLGASSSDSKGQ